jgi:hypothetical protein
LDAAPHIEASFPLTLWVAVDPITRWAVTEDLGPMSITIAPSPIGPPQGDPAGQAVASLRGYAYQLYASALAWLRLSDDEECTLR